MSWRPSLVALSLTLSLTLGGCSGYQKWTDEEPLQGRPGSTVDERWKTPDNVSPDGTYAQTASVSPFGDAGAGPGPVDLVVDDALFRNTYYDFPREGSGDRDTTLFDASCAPIVKVPQKFHDQLCVQGSGKLTSGATVSFAKRDCACASVCPRTGQKICYERLDPARFPHGRGATGGPITPLLSVAVDVSVIPLGTPLFIPEMVGVPRADGSPHDGCFIAQDRGLRVVGKHIDIFTGDPSMTQAWNARVPSNLGVHVRIADPRCSRLVR
jgi:3D (Asp-Asp-Asp) domain-containing protein